MRPTTHNKKRHAGSDTAFDGLHDFLYSMMKRAKEADTNDTGHSGETWVDWLDELDRLHQIENVFSYLRAQLTELKKRFEDASDHCANAQEDVAKVFEDYDTLLFEMEDW